MIKNRGFMRLIRKFFNELNDNGIKNAIYKTIHYLNKNKSPIKILKNTGTNRKDCGAINHNPLVSIIAVNYNGALDLPKFIKSIEQQSYRNFELIIVDNNSKDNSIDIISGFCGSSKTLIKLVKQDHNIGFAEGNNIAIPYCSGEFYCLVNVDTILDQDWLKELVDAIVQDGTCGAVCSKTLFFERFQDIELSSEKDFNLNLESILSSLDYKKYFIRHGNKKDEYLESINGSIKLSVPVQDKKLSLLVEFKEKNIDHSLRLKIAKNKEVYYKLKDIIKLNVDFSHNTVINSSHIINNVGSISINNYPQDRGFGEYDTGQYDSKCYLDFFCGVSVLLRRSILINRKIFIPEFFAYYEDSELSRYIRELGYNILYAPRSILYHKHSATSSEYSPLWHLLVNRSKEIYSYTGDIKKLEENLIKIENTYKPSINKNIFDTINSFSSTLIKRLQENNSLVEKEKSIGIYNSYWNTKGGGESHALSVASILREYASVYLISENNFDIDELSKYYDINLEGCIKIVQNNINSELTSQFDIFINSTYLSDLISLAKKSYYIVSFPQKNVDIEFLSNYTFLHNSDYTAKWANIYWGKHNYDILYPFGMIDTNPYPIKINKEKIILSVGRFFKFGHSKNQHVIAKAFKYMVNKNKELKDWKLVLIGSINYNSEDDMLYYREIKELLADTNSEIILNSNRETLIDYYSKAAIYVHATGIGIDHNKYPSKLEHFGITPVEAIINGCYPIVYSYGGPADFMTKLGIGSHYKNNNELIIKLHEACDIYNKNKLDFNKIRELAIKFINDYKFDNKVSRLYTNGEDHL